MGKGPENSKEYRFLMGKRNSLDLKTKQRGKTEIWVAVNSVFGSLWGYLGLFDEWVVF